MDKGCERLEYNAGSEKVISFPCNFVSHRIKINEIHSVRGILNFPGDYLYIYMCGFCIYCQICHTYLFGEEGKYKKNQTKNSLSLPSGPIYPPVAPAYSADLRQLIDAMLQRDPKDRPSVNAIQSPILPMIFSSTTGGGSAYSWPPIIGGNQ